MRSQRKSRKPPTSNRASHSDRGKLPWTPAVKTLFFERRFGLPISNFAGMVLGPRLANGDRSLLLIADNGRGTWQSIYALRLRGVP
jgi:hypothetical protein